MTRLVSLSLTLAATLPLGGLLLGNTGCTSIYGMDAPVGCTETEDADGDGFLSEACLGAGNADADCDDRDRATFPGAPERCNGVDDDCDRRIDEGALASPFYVDCDGDGVGRDEVARVCGAELLPEPPCEGGQWVMEPGDCDDDDPLHVARCGDCAEVDVVFTIDDAPGMRPIQLALSSALPALVDALASGDLDGDGEADREPVTALHFGVIRSDLGSGSARVPGCERSGEGLLITRPDAFDPACDRSFPPFSALEDDPAGFLEEARCRAEVGEIGCAFTQPLEAALWGLTPASSRLRFDLDQSQLGHADLGNDDLLGEEGLLVTVVVSDGDDCSVRPGGEFIFDLSGLSADLACAFEGSESLYPVRRFTSGLLEVRGERDHLFALLAGTSPDEPLEPTAADYERLRRELVPTVEPGEEPRLAASCETPEVRATPPARLVALAASLAERDVPTLLGSVCAPDLSAFTGALAARIHDRLDARCGAR